jgi:hypothetical protein
VPKTSLTFLSADILITPHYKHHDRLGSLEVYKFFEDTSSADASLNPIQVAEYHLPGFTERTAAVHFHHTCPELSDLLNDQQIISMSIRTMGSSFSKWSGTIFVNTRDILQQARAASGGSCSVIPWDAWGPQSTRLFATLGYCSPCANRSIFLDRLQNPPSFLRLLDFHPFNMIPNIPPPPNTSIRRVEDKSVVAGGFPFESDVITSLPYREITVELDGIFSDTFTMLRISTEMIVAVSLWTS